MIYDNGDIDCRVQVCYDPKTSKWDVQIKWRRRHKDYIQRKKCATDFEAAMYVASFIERKLRGRK